MFKTESFRNNKKVIMTIDEKVKDEKLQILILIEKLQKYQHYQQTKLLNLNILLVKNYYLQVKVK